MKVDILEHAKLEIDDAFEYYNLQQDGLGISFKNDVKTSIDRIVKLPELYPKASDNIRRSLLHRFPYSIFYTLLKDRILILAIAHQSRKPFYWVEHYTNEHV